MAENDIEDNRKRYKRTKQKIRDGTYLKPTGQTQYYIRNKINAKYFEKIFKEFEYKDISYIRRIQHIKALRKTCYFTKKDLKQLTQDDVKGILIKTNKVHHTVNTRRDYVNYNKAIWKILFPETDHKGRADTSIVPHAWRIKVNSDKNLQKDREDKLTDTEYARIMKSLSNDPRMQLWYCLLFECLARPQELCYITLSDVEVHDNYARIRISSHGKEGTKTLQIIEGYYYLTQWLNKHPI